MSCAPPILRHDCAVRRNQQFHEPGHVEMANWIKDKLPLDAVSSNPCCPATTPRSPAPHAQPFRVGLESRSCTDQARLRRRTSAAPRSVQVLAGPMSSLAEHQLLTGRKIVTHPHYENYRLRQRVHDSYQVTKECSTCTRLPHADDYLKTCVMAPGRGPNPLLWPHPPRSWPHLRRDSPLPRRARGVGSASADLRSCFAGGRAQDAQRHRSGIRPR